MPQQTPPAPNELAAFRATLQRQIQKAEFVLSLRERFPDASTPRDALALIGMSPESVNLAFAHDGGATIS